MDKAQDLHASLWPMSQNIACVCCCLTAVSHHFDSEIDVERTTCSFAVYNFLARVLKIKVLTTNSAVLERLLIAVF